MLFKILKTKQRLTIPNSFLPWSDIHNSSIRSNVETTTDNMPSSPVQTKTGTSCWNSCGCPSLVVFEGRVPHIHILHSYFR